MKNMTQNTTQNDKREQCDTKHSTLKIYLTRKNFTPYPVPPAHVPASVERYCHNQSKFINNLLTAMLFPIFYRSSIFQIILLGTTNMLE
jgi:hypothetical protein